MEIFIFSKGTILFNHFFYFVIIYDFTVTICLFIGGAGTQGLKGSDKDL